MCTLSLYLIPATCNPQHTLRSEVDYAGHEHQPPVGSVQLLGLASRPQQVLLDGQQVPFDYEQHSQILHVRGLQIALTREFQLRLVSHG